MKLLRLVFSVVLLSQPLLAQRLHIGVKGGVPLSNPFNFTSLIESPTFFAAYSSKPNRYTIGPTVELSGLPWDLGVEVDVLYKHLHYDYSDQTAFTSASAVSTLGQRNTTETFTNYRFTFDRWEFPILAKYKPSQAAFSVFAPYVIGGLSINHVSHTTFSGERGFRQYPFPPTGEPLPPFTVERLGPDLPQYFPYEFAHRSATGVVIGGGMEWRLAFLHISPELRYTHWTKRNFGYNYTASCPPQPKPTPYFCSNENQLEILMGVTF